MLSYYSSPLQLFLFKEREKREREKEREIFNKKFHITIDFLEVRWI